MTDQPVFTAAELETVAPFDRDVFTNEDAVDLGLIAVSLIRERQLSLAVRIELHGDHVFVAKLGTTGPGNDAWITGKTLVVREHGVPSLLVRRRMEAEGTWSREAALGGQRKYAGGSIPLFVAGELAGTITCSGEADFVDHEIAAESVRRYLAR